MKRAEVLALMNRILVRQGKPPIRSEADSLSDAGFRSLDFSELAVRVENTLGKELQFTGAQLRAIRTVGHVVDLFSKR